MFDLFGLGKEPISITLTSLIDLLHYQFNRTKAAMQITPTIVPSILKTIGRANLFGIGVSYIMSFLLKSI